MCRSCSEQLLLIQRDLLPLLCSRSFHSRSVQCTQPSRLSLHLCSCQELPLPALSSTSPEYDRPQGVRRASRCTLFHSRPLKHSPLLLLSGRAARSYRLHCSAGPGRQVRGQLSCISLRFDNAQVLLRHYCHGLAAVETVAEVC